jgi:signal recognition particle GTPase
MSEKENKFKNLSELIGKGVEVKENQKTEKKREEEYFMDLIEELCQIDASSAIANSLGINLSKYENRFIQVFEMTLTKIYGEVKASIILWWVFESITPEGELLPLIDENDKKHLIKTPTQLYKFLKRYE